MQSMVYKLKIFFIITAIIVSCGCIHEEGPIVFWSKTIYPHTDDLGSCGEQGVFSRDSMISRRSGASYCFFDDHSFFLFGGLGPKCGLPILQGDLNDLWEYNYTHWKWISGNATEVNVPGHYSGNEYAFPGGRSSQEMVCSISKRGETVGEREIIMFGGRHGSYLNDLWIYNIDRGIWTHMNGTDSSGVSDIKGERYVYGKSRIGDKGYFSMVLFDDKIAIFGGNGERNDLFTIDTTHFKVAHYFGTPPVAYPSLISKRGVYNSSNVIGGRYDHLSWKVSSSEFFVFGGFGRSLIGISTGRLGDLWMYSFDFLAWKYVSGYNDLYDDTVRASRRYFEKGKVFEKGKYPIHRNAAGGFAYDNKIFLYGGAFGATTSNLNDLTIYDIKKDKWVLAYGEYPALDVFAYSGDYSVDNLVYKRYSPIVTYSHDIHDNNELLIYISNGFSMGMGDSNDMSVFKQMVYCNGYLFNDEQNTCNGHGTCIGYDKCACENEYYGDFCQITYCGEYLSNETKVCSGRGFCSFKICDCLPNFKGELCEIPVCYEKRGDAHDVCSGHGQCMKDNLCQCLPKFEGELCSKCVPNYGGDNCSYSICHGKLENEIGVCSGHGKCMKDNVCQCDYGWGDLEECSNINTFYAVMQVWYIPVIVLLLIVIVISFVLFLFFSLCIIISKQRKTLKKVEEIGDIDILLEEKRLDEDKSIAHLRINSKLFLINFSDIKLLSKIGAGGSSSEVFLCDWKGEKAAFKNFKSISNVVQSQKNFDEFEKEVGILASVSHPNILKFFGAMMGQRLGILMEYGDSGEIGKFLLLFKNKNGYKFPILEKVRLVKEISSGMNHLHSVNVIHRDLKSENVLICGKSLIAKIMDFGISRVVEGEEEYKTKRVGTSYYMAPEIFLSGKYNEKVDVYSFGILLFVILTEKLNPFGKESIGIELKVANDENFRPKINKTDFQNVPDWLMEMMKNCWNHNPKARPSFSKILNIIKGEGGGRESIKLDNKSNKNIKELEKKIEELKKENEKLKKKLEEK